MEILYQYIWNHRLLGNSLRTVDGRNVEVLYQGRLNNDAGPDFTGARLLISGKEWCGNVEIHVRASDWFRHHHDTDPAYQNVILHVVAVNDAEIPGAQGSPIPQTIATFPQSFISLYSRLAQTASNSPCLTELPNLSPLTITDWISSLTIERLQQKATRIRDNCRALNGDWQQTCFTTLARALGFGLNADPLETLARITPLNFIARHSDDPFQIEALIFGQAGMLDSSIHIFDEYYQALCREYAFLARKYSLRPMRRDLWKFSKTRPQNFPGRRIAMLAASLVGGFSLLSQIIDNAEDPDTLRTLFNWQLSEYWASHFDFDLPGLKLPNTLSPTNLDLLLINFAAPIIYAYAADRGNPELAELAISLWEKLPAENNRYTRRWSNSPLPANNAADSQALIQLSREYCDANRCLQCRFGHAILRKARF